MSYKLTLRLVTLILLISPVHTMMSHDSWGHKVIEAAAYKNLLMKQRIPGSEGVSGKDIVEFLIKHRVLDLPPMYLRDELKVIGQSGNRDTSDYSIYDWFPEAKSGSPDIMLDRQFAENGQPFHFMAQVKDLENKSESNIHSMPPDLLTKAYPRCVRFMSSVVYKIIVSDFSADFGQESIYELIHAIADSYSTAHVERDTSDWSISYLCVWKGVSLFYPFTEAEQKFLHDFPFEPRDNVFLKNPVVLVNDEIVEAKDIPPYAIPYDSLSENGKQSSLAIENLLVTIYRLMNVGSRIGDSTAVTREITDEQNDIWRQYLRQHFVTKDDSLNETILNHARLEPQPPSEKKWSPGVAVGLRYRHTQSNLDLSFALYLELPGIITYPLPLTYEYELGYRQYHQKEIDDRLFLATSLTGSALNIPLYGAININICPLVLDISATKSFDFFGDIYFSSRADVILSKSFWLGIEGPRYSYKRGVWDGDGSISIGMLFDFSGPSTIQEQGQDVSLPEISLLDRTNNDYSTVQVVSNFALFEKLTSDNNAFVGLPVLNFQGLTKGEIVGIDHGIGYAGQVLFGIRTTQLSSQFQFTPIERVSLLKPVSLEVLPAMLQLIFSPKFAFRGRFKPGIGIACNFLFYDFSVYFAQWSDWGKMNFGFYGFRVGVLDL